MEMAAYGFCICNSSYIALVHQYPCKKIARDERRNIQTWANAVEKRASLVRYTEEFLKKSRQKNKNALSFGPMPPGAL